MALVRRNPNANPESAPQADSPAASAATNTTTTSSAAADAPAAPQSSAPAESPATAQAETKTVSATGQGHPANRGLVRASTGGALSTATKMPPVLDNLKDVMTVDFDTFIRLKAGVGDIQDNDSVSFGKAIELLLVSWQDNWDISPGVDDDEARKLVKYSDDGVTLNDGTGMLITDYVNFLKTEGYKDANVKKKATLVGLLEAAENGNHPVVQGLLGNTVALSLSSQGRKTFDRYRFDRSIKVQMGKATAEGAERLLITAHAKKNGKNNYTLLEVTSAG
jgi:hypothetical protein